MSDIPDVDVSSDREQAQLQKLLQTADRAAIKAAAEQFVRDENKTFALQCYEWLSQDKSDLDARFTYAHVIEDGSHRTRALSRDILLALLTDFPEIVATGDVVARRLIRSAALRCRDVGPFDTAIDLFRRLAPLSDEARDYFWLSEILVHGNFLDESVQALERAMQLDPDRYDTDANRDTLKIGRTSQQTAQRKKIEKKKIGRYPQTADFTGELQPLIKNFLAADLRHSEKFVKPSTRFFTMGSCFARNISTALVKNGYTSRHMEISEYINTTFANRAFVDWLSGAGQPDVNARIMELLPEGWNAETLLDIIKNSDVFVLTLGVAPAFFDQATGEYVLPRPSGLNSRVLAEKYEYRTTGVAENVENVLYLIRFIRALSPAIRVVVTVSPVPMVASFEFESCVVADCLSKSTMRLVAHEVVNQSGLTDIVYWPSFEVFRWAGSNASNFYAADDGAAWHVSEDKVGSTIKAFIEVFSAPAQTSTAT